jgi:hydrogenase maturation protease
MSPVAVSERPIGVLVLGLGNVLLSDDGLGAAAVARLERDWRIPDGVRLEDGGTLGLSLLGLLSDAEQVIIVDAVRTDDPPGSLVRIDGAAVIDAVRDRLSVHQVGVADLLDAARLIDCYPTGVTLIGLVPETLDLAVERSAAIERRIDDLVEAIISEVQSHGYELVLEADTASGDRPVHALARHFGM